MEEARIPEPGELLDLVQDALFVVDEEGKILHVSAGCQYLLGYRPSEMLGRNMTDYVHPEDRERTLTRVWQIMAGVAATRFRNRWIHMHGHPVEIEWAANWSEKHRVRVATARAVEPPEPQV